MTLPQKSDILGQGVIASFGHQAAQVLFVPSQACRHAPTVRFGLGRTGAAELPPQFLDGFQVHLEEIGNLRLREFSRLAG
jgi:hypothetical protein